MPEDAQNLQPISERIKHDSKLQTIDLDDAAHEHTVWADLGHTMQYCGSFPDTHTACLSAAEHTGLKHVYVAHGPLSHFGILKI